MSDIESSSSNSENDNLISDEEELDDTGTFLNNLKPYQYEPENDCTGEGLETSEERRI